MSDDGLSSLESNHYYKPFTTTTAGFVIPMMTGLLSACSSGLIIYIISRSQQKLSTTYHRIMTFMSFFDIISSLFIALGTIMMPSDCIFKFAGPMLGNKVTCQLQGWFILYGIGGATLMYASLVWYFVLKITFKISTQTIEKYFEPIVYVVNLASTLIFPTLILSNDLINPHVYDGFCTIAPYPESCDMDMWYNWNFCTWGDGIVKTYLEYSIVPFAGIGACFTFVVIGAFFFIIMSVIRNKKEIQVLEANQIARDASQSSDNDEESENSKIEWLKYDRVLIIQSLMYVGALFVTWLLFLLSGGFNIASFALDAASIVIFLLQGTWNLLIFLYDKAHLVMQQGDHDNAMNFWQAAKKIILSPSDVPTMVLLNLIPAINTKQPDLEQQPKYYDHALGGADDIPAKDIVSEYDDLTNLREDNNGVSEEIDSSDGSSWKLSAMSGGDEKSIMNSSVVQKREYIIQEEPSTKIRRPGTLGLNALDSTPDKREIAKSI